MEEMTIISALGYSVLGICIVFAALIILMGVIKIMGAVIGKAGKKEEAPAVAPAPVAAAPKAVAPGSAG